jgi:hypothetical protein
MSIPNPLPESCTFEEPQLAPLGSGHFVACHFPELPEKVEVA